MRLAARVGVWAAGGMLLWLLAWRVFGYAAPWQGLAAGLPMAGLAWWVASRIGRVDEVVAARRADGCFGLKDGLVSWLDFRDRGLTGEVRELDERQLEAHLGGLDARRVVPEPPRRWLVALGVMGVAVAVLSMLPHRADVRARLAAEAEMLERSATVADELAEVVEAMIEAMDENERAELDPEALRGMLGGVEKTRDGRELEKQLARIEQQVAAAMAGLSSRQDEAALRLAAAELEKSSHAEARRTGRDLEAKDFAKAAERMRAMKPQAGKAMTPEERRAAREQSRGTRELAGRMARGVRGRDLGKGRADAKPAGEVELREEAMEMADLLEELDEAARDLDGALEDLEEMEWDDDALERAGRLARGMDGLGDRLGRLAARRKALEKLENLRAGLADARRFGQGRSQMLGLAGAMSGPQAGSGGKEAGQGSDDRRRDPGEEEGAREGLLADLQGQDSGQGAAARSVESADSGGGVATRSAGERERAFAAQLESLVHRDDVPEALKRGVREYFQTIHENPAP